MDELMKLSWETPGWKKVTAEMIKNVWQKVRKVLLKIHNRIWKNEQIPEDCCKIPFTVRINNKGHRNGSNNYRGISVLLYTTMKMLYR